MIQLFALLALACAVRTPPELFPEPTRAMTPPELEPLPEPPADDAPAVASFIPGQPAPYVHQGVATVRGHVVPAHKALQLYRASAELLPYWEGRARTCNDSRQRDQEYAQGRLEDLWDESQAVRLRSAALPWAVTGGIVLGLAGGVLGTLAVLEAVCGEQGCADIGALR